MKPLKRVLYLLFFLSFYAHATPDNIYTASVKGDFDRTYKAVYQALENNRLFVVFEPDIGANLSGFAKRWGEDYNRNKLEHFKAMMFCNGWYANQVSNKDVKMTALCPLHVTLTHKNGLTSVHFVRPDRVARNSKAAAITQELTELVIKAITEGLANSKKTTPP